MPDPSYTPLAPPGTLAGPLLAWFAQVSANRDMPWRRTVDPYAIWLSETMLQQTQVATVIPYYQRFLARFPTLPALAEASLEEVLSLWAGLGYYRRAKHLHRAAQAVVQRHAGVLPASVDALRDLPGIGRYTAGAIASIAFNLPAPVVDGNVMRVLARLAAYDRDIAIPKNHAFFWELAEAIHAGVPACALPAPGAPLRPGEAMHGNVNQALMELGATVCTPTAPSCLLCPLKQACRAFAEGRQEQLPVKARRGETPRVRGMAVVILRRHAGREEVLLMQRPAGGTWEHMWEFPVLSMPGKRPESEALAALIGDALGLKVEIAGGRRLPVVKHQLTHRLMEYAVVLCKSAGKTTAPRLPACGDAHYSAARWAAWPLATEMPMARVVGKIAGVASSLAS